jgi:hypothetical protein
MILNSRNSDALRRLMLNGANIEGQLDSVTAFTLPGIMEALASATAPGLSKAFYREIERYCRNNKGSALYRAVQSWNFADSAHLGHDIHGVRQLEFYRLRVRADQTSLSYLLYQERFDRSLQKLGGFSTGFAKALAGVLVEMTDNVIQHSERAPSSEQTGLAGYHVSSGFMCFAVIDIGQGILGSLSKSPAWKHLLTAEGALRAAVCEFASIRPDEPNGDGFRTLFRKLADRNCRLRFRSDNAVLTIEDVCSHREGVLGNSPALRGLSGSLTRPWHLLTS